jgi:hypothetical protein
MVKKVLCSDCGFFCRIKRYPIFEGSRRSSEYIEITEDARSLFQQQHPSFLCDYNDMEGSVSITCRRKQFLLATKEYRGSPLPTSTPEEIRLLHRCSCYVDYNAGYSPDEHKELYREIENRKSLRNATLLGAGIGAGAAIVTQIAYLLFT